MTLINFMAAMVSILFWFGALFFLGVAMLDAVNGRWWGALFSAWVALICFSGHKKLWRFTP